MIFFEEEPELDKEEQGQQQHKKSNIFFEDEDDQVKEKVESIKQNSPIVAACDRVRKIKEIGQKVQSVPVEEQCQTLDERIKRIFSQYRLQKQYLYKPVDTGSRTKMILYRQKDLLKTIYRANIEANGRLYRMATKKQSSLNTIKYEFSLLLDFIDNIEKEPFYIGKMVNKGTQFQVFQDGFFEVHTHQKILRRHGSIIIMKQLFSPVVINLLTPSVGPTGFNTLEANDLSDMWAIKNRQPGLVQTFNNQTLDDREYETINMMMGCRKSAHSIVLQNVKSKKHALVVGRVSDDQFVVEIYQGLSPYLAFCFSVAWLS